MKAITAGNWEVTEIDGVESDVVYYISTEQATGNRDLYSVRLNGKDKKRITTRNGYYTITPSSGMNYFISVYSDVSTPHIYTLHRATGAVVRVLDEKTALKQAIPKSQIPTQEYFA